MDSKSTIGSDARATLFVSTLQHVVTNNTLTTPGARCPCHLAMHATGVPKQAPSRYAVPFQVPVAVVQTYSIQTHEPGYHWQVVDYRLVCQYASDASQSVLLRTVTIFYGKRSKRQFSDK